MGARGLLTKVIYALFSDRLATDHEHLLKPKGVPPTVLSTVPYRRRAVDWPYGMCQAGAREYFRRVINGSKAHSRRRSGVGRGRPVRDTTVVIQRVCGIVVTVYLALILVVPSRWA